MEVSLSFDNAVVNASVLKTWDEFWQKLFLGLGIIIAVFGMRLVFPLVIVAVAADLGMAEVWNLALTDPKAFSMHLTNHHAEVAAFGGMFLLLVFLNFLLDDEKELHWLGNFEKKLGSLGKVSSIAVMIALGTLMGSMTHGRRSAEDDRADGRPVGHPDLRRRRHDQRACWKRAKRAAAKWATWSSAAVSAASCTSKCSTRRSRFDGVIGAFAITSDVVIIMLGLAIGAMFVRSMTVYLVDKGTLDQYVYLEHGAHYAIGILAADHVGEYEVPHPGDLHRPDRRGLHRRLAVVVAALQQAAAPRAGETGRSAPLSSTLRHTVRSAYCIG